MKPEIGRRGDPEDKGRGGPRAAGEPLAELENLAWLLDNSIQVPGVRFRIGVDSLLGLVPVLGDLVGAAISSYILWLGARMGVPRVTLLRMALNVALESAAGVVPFVGDLFDMAWKANTRNVELLKAHVLDPKRAKRGDWLFSILLLLALLGLLALFGWAAFSLGRLVIGAFRS